MNLSWLQPVNLFPVLALLFAALALLRWRTPAARAWLILAVVFGAVAAWLRWT